MAKLNEIQDKINGKQLSPTSRLKDLVMRVDIKKRLEEVLGKKAPGFISSLLSLYTANQALQACDPMSIISSAMIAATLDLPINPNLGYAFLIPYGGVCQFQMSAKGFTQLAIRTGLYQTMNSVEIFEGELVQYNRITGDFEIDETKKKSDKVVAYLAYIRLLTGFSKSLLMTTDQVKRHAQRYSKSYSKAGTPWQTEFDKMAMKTVLKLLLSKFGVLSIEMQRAMEFDQSAVRETPEGLKPDYIEGVEINDAQEPPPLTGEAAPKKDEELPLKS